MIKKKQVSIYDPVRRMSDDTFFKTSISVAKNGFVSREGGIAANLPDLIFEKMILPAIDFINTLPNSDEDNAPTIENLLRLRHWVPTYAQYHLCGNQIFDIGSPLLDMFEQTSIKDTSLADLELPYESFYLYFGRREKLSSAWEVDPESRLPLSYEYINGAYISRVIAENNAFRLKIGFSMCREDGSPVIQNGPIIDLLPHELSMETTSAIQAALQRRIQELQNDSQKEFQGFTEYRMETYREMFDLFSRSVELVVNCLYYLEVIGSSGLTKSPDRTTPAELDAAWQNAKISGNENRKQNVAKQIFKAGASFVYLLGHRFDAAAYSTGTSKDVRLHWRRGHYREQAYGPGHSMRKTIRIAPVLVRADLLKTGSTVADPHVYAVDLSSSVMH